MQACIAPEDWRPPPPAGFLDAAGMRRVEEEPWRQVHHLAAQWPRTAMPLYDAVDSEVHSV